MRISLVLVPAAERAALAPSILICSNPILKNPLIVTLDCASARPGIASAPATATAMSFLFIKESPESCLRTGRLSLPG